MIPVSLKKLQIALTSVFILSSIIFFCVYFPLSYQACQETINRTPEYISNHTCFCKNNVGATNVAARKMVNDTEWFRQFDSPLYDIYFTYSMDDKNVRFYFPAVTNWINQYYAMIFTNKITTVTIDSLEFNDPLSFYSKTSTESLCLIMEIYSNNTSQSSFSNDTEVCREMITSYFPNFNPTLTIEYDSNKVYQNVCGEIDYCEITYCSTNSTVSIILFCCSIITSIYTVTKVINYLMVYFYKRRYGDKTEQIHISKVYENPNV